MSISSELRRAHHNISTSIRTSTLGGTSKLNTRNPCVSQDISTKIYFLHEGPWELEFKQGRTIAREQGDVPDGDELIATYFHVVLDYEMVKVEKGQRYFDAK